MQLTTLSHLLAYGVLKSLDGNITDNYNVMGRLNSADRAMDAVMDYGKEEEEGNDEESMSNIEPGVSGPQLRAGLGALRASNLGMQEKFANVDEKLFGMYGDIILHNNGTHLDGVIGVAKDWKIQRLWLQIVSDPHPLYEIPRGKIRNRSFENLNFLVEGRV